MSRKKKKNSFRPGTEKMKRSAKANISETDFDELIFFRSNNIRVPYGKSHGTDAENEVMNILESSNIPPSLVLKPKLVKEPLRGEIEISDGIILYGDTAFLMQIKSRNLKEDEINQISTALDAKDVSVAKTERRKIEKLVSHAYRQCKDSLSYINASEEMEFEQQDGNFKKIKYKDYNWVSLILINHPNFSDINSIETVDEDNSENREIPRVIMSVQDLESMSSGFNRIPYYVLNYLRRLQYQSKHELGNDAPRFTNFMVHKIHDYSKHNYFIEYEKFIMEIFERKDIDKELAKHLLYPLDFSTVEEMERVQKAFESKFLPTSKLPSKDFMIFEETKIGYATLFYDSRELPTEQITRYQLGEISADYYKRYENKIDIIITIAVDVCPYNPHRTVGFLGGLH